MLAYSTPNKNDNIPETYTTTNMPETYTTTLSTDDNLDQRTTHVVSTIPNEPQGDNTEKVAIVTSDNKQNIDEDDGKLSTGDSCFSTNAVFGSDETNKRHINTILITFLMEYICA